MLPHPTVARKGQVAGQHTGLFNSFNARFSVIPATTHSLREQAYQLRYQVYCCERSYENPAEYYHKRETDEYDNHSVHALLFDRTSGTAAGTVRLILPNPNSPATSLPILRICGDSLLEDLKLQQTDVVAEVSRFAISKAYRKAPHIGKPGQVLHTGVDAIDHAQLIPCLTVGLLKATVQMSFSLGISDWLAIMEPALLRLLTRFGFHFTPIGHVVDHHGMRQPCHANINCLMARVHREHPGIWDYITDQGRSLRGSSSFFASCQPYQTSEVQYLTPDTPKGNTLPLQQNCRYH